MAINYAEEGSHSTLFSTCISVVIYTFFIACWSLVSPFFSELLSSFLPSENSAKITTNILFLLFSGALLFYLINRQIKRSLGRAEYARTLFEISTTGGALSRLSGEFVDVNESFAQIIGRTVPEALTLTYRDITPKEFLVADDAELKTLESTGEYGPYEKEYIHKNGDRIAVLLSGRRLTIDGECYIWSSVEKLGDRKNVENELRHSQAKLKKALSSELEKNSLLNTAQQITNMGFITWDLKSEDIFWSDHLYKIYGVQLGTPQTIETNIALVYPEDLAVVKQSIEDAIAGIKDHDIVHRIIRADGEVIWVEAKAHVEYSGGCADKLIGTIVDITLRKSAEDNYRRLFSMMRDAYAINKGSGELLECNPAYIEMLGYDENEIKQVNWRDITPQKWLEWEVKTFGAQLLERGFTDVYEKEYLRKDGSAVPIEVQAYLLNDPEHIEDAIIGGIIRDISQRKVDELARSESEQRFRQLAENINQVFWLGSPDWQEIYYISPAYEEKWGRTMQSLYDNPTTWFDAIHPDDKQQVKDDLPNSIEDIGELIKFRDYRVVKPDGEVRWIQARGYPIKEPGEKVTRIAGIAEDITELKLQQEKLLSNSQIVTSMTEGAYLIRISDGIILYTNPAFERMFGYEKDEMLGEHVSIVNAPTELDPLETVESISQQIEVTGSWSGEVNNIRKDGTTFWCSASVTTFTHPEHGPIWVSVHTDITKKRNAESTLRRTQKMDALGKLTGGVAHDYNNMLGVILGYAELLINELDDNAKLTKYAKSIQHAGERGAKLTKKLLYFSKQDTTGVVAIDINKVVREELNLLEKTLTANIKVNTVLAETLWMANLDSGELEDALLNICINSMHAMSGSGEVILKTSNQVLRVDEAARLGVNTGEYVVLSIQDNGCGMEEQTITSMFDPFFTTKGDKGTGLGLSQVYGFVERSKGAMAVNSVVNEGTNLALYFPHADGKQLNINNKLRLTSENIQGCETILVVDDEVALLSLIREVLQTHGYKVIIASGAQKALAILEEHSVDLIISDVIMPQMNGFEFISIVTEKYPQLQVQLVSGFSDNINTKDIDKSLIDNIINKPFPMETLLKRIGFLLASVG